MNESTDAEFPVLPLSGLRVIELNPAHRLPMCARLLADLGAEVLLIEPPQGLAARRAPPLVAGLSLDFATQYANKRSVVLDLDSATGREQLLALLATAQLFIDATAAGTLDALGLGQAELQARLPALVTLAISDFGHSGPYRDHIATPAVHAAMSGMLCRSGLPGREPLLPPGALAWEAAAVQAAWVALLGLWQQQAHGEGGHLDLSIHETVAQVMDPALGITGSAAAGTSALDTTPHGRPPAVPLYPLIPCLNGHVRICVLNPRQWEAMRSWLGEDHAFTDPKYARIAERAAVFEALNAAIARLFAPCTPQQLVQEGQRRGVPIAAVACPADVLQDAHFLAREAFVPWPLAPGLVGQMASGYLEIDGRRAGPRTPAPALGAHTPLLRTLPAAPPPGPARPGSAGELPPAPRPLQGLRVLDLGVIVAGAEAGRLLADQGAEVIKVESHAFPDGGRQSRTDNPMTVAIAVGHRNKQSLGLNLRSPGGLALFKRLVEVSDVLLSNFKPGTLEALGLGPEVLRGLNPRLVMMDSSALGNTGPQSRSLGYGPLVRAASGMSWLWRYPGEDDAFSDGVTVYPDHLAGRLAALGVMALLLRRLRAGPGGQGGRVSLSQAEIFLNGQATGFLRESLCPGTLLPRSAGSEFQAPDGVYPCRGDDAWCVISVRDDQDWQRLRRVLAETVALDEPAWAQTAARVAQRARLDALVSDWTRLHTPEEVMTRLQAVGVPAGPMRRLSEYRSDPQFSARGFIHGLQHPGLPQTLPAEGGPALGRLLPLPALAPAPYQAEHTRAIMARVLGLGEAQIQTLLDAGDLEAMAPT